ncbi:histidinol-phosphatase [Streptomyces silvisoli]|uniref:Histidinol-phosphatase n=1 Tax=Streptomyces silvisoli TaxID=3034235 RepID=A0ABT5ZKD1_9ACTN|nr:histidinol-phosphatase [Streptomyces silvisoli]MDF3290293.1 histidinol-phosphatase [Streptomyces silvisoli]
MFDLHTHHERCGHARGTMRDYVESAITQGLHTIGLSDHSPFFGEAADHALPGVAMPKSTFAAYIAEAMALREEYWGRINVLVGVESDYFPEHAELYRNVYARYDLDYLIGSVHVLDGVDLFRKERWEQADHADLKAAREQYCNLVAQSAEAGMFDVLGHIDVIKAACPEIASIATPAVDRMLRAIADADTVIEVNTSGKTKDCGGWYPSGDILERARKYGVKLTFGSDAHDPERVGDEHENVRDELRRLGFREWYVFERRRRIRMPL